MTDFRHYDQAVLSVMELLTHADDEDNWATRRAVNTEDLTRMGLEVAQTITRTADWQVKLEKERGKARRKARVLLKRHVTARQWKEFLKKKAFHITGSDGHVYRIGHQIGSSVTLVVGGQDVARYCLVPKGDVWIPEPDMMLALKLMLETDAKRFLRRANRTDLRRAG